MEAINVRYDNLERLATIRIVHACRLPEAEWARANARYKRLVPALIARRLRELDRHWAKDALRYPVRK